MKFPQFGNDREMGEWFEENDIDPESLEVAEDVTVAKDLTVSVVAEFYSIVAPGTSVPTAAPTVEGQRDKSLTPAIN